MATAVPQQQRGGGGVPKGRPKDAAAAGQEGKNRRVLGDIGNLVAVRAAVLEGKPLPEINRPITRSFGAQLLANAQDAAKVDAGIKKPVALAGDGVKEVKPKAAFKSNVDVVVIEISPDQDEEIKERPVSKKSTKKKVHSLSSVLTARSKAACGISDKPKVFVLEIDASDADDQLAVVDYVEDLYKFYKLSESLNRPNDYMGSQAEINEKMRAILADWLVEVHNKFELTPEALYLTFYIIDRYLSLEQVCRRELQLVGMSSMLIASKYEEIWAPQVEDFIMISDHAYKQEQVLAMEKTILNKLEWNLTVPTQYVFLARFIKAALCDKEMERMVFFFAELGLIQYSMIKYCPSIAAASAVYAARCTLKKTPLWTETLKHHTGFAESQLLDCAQVLVNCHSAAPESRLKTIYKKYSSTDLGAVALQPPVAKLLAELKASSASV